MFESGNHSWRWGLFITNVPFVAFVVIHNNVRLHVNTREDCKAQWDEMQYTV
jgi:hypothetical protein